MWNVRERQDFDRCVEGIFENCTPKARVTHNISYFRRRRKSPPSSLMVPPVLLIMVYCHFSASTASKKQTLLPLSSRIQHSFKQAASSPPCLLVRRARSGESAFRPNGRASDVLAAMLSCSFAGSHAITPAQSPCSHSVPIHHPRVAIQSLFPIPTNDGAI